jgi:hypothetical protein
MWWLRAFAVRYYPSFRLSPRATHNTKRIVRAFLIEEAKVVKRVIKSQQNVAGGRS